MPQIHEIVLWIGVFGCVTNFSILVKLTKLICLVDLERLGRILWSTMLILQNKVVEVDQTKVKLQVKVALMPLNL